MFYQIKQEFSSFEQMIISIKGEITTTVCNILEMVWCFDMLSD